MIRWLRSHEPIDDMCAYLSSGALGYIALLAAVSGMGCAPMPVGVPLTNAGPAINVAYEVLGPLAPADRPEVLGVKPDPSCEHGRFRSPHDGRCKTGLYYPDERVIFLAVGARAYSVSLCHELLHHVGFEHWGGTWEPGSWPALLNEQCRAALAARPEIDRMQFPAEEEPTR